MKESNANPVLSASAEVQSGYVFSGYSKRGRAQFVLNGQRYLGTGKLEECDGDGRANPDLLASHTPCHQHGSLRNQVFTCSDWKNGRLYRFTGTLDRFDLKASDTIPIEPNNALQLNTQGRPSGEIQAPNRPNADNYVKELRHIRQAADAGLDPDLRLDFIARYVNESRSNLYRKMNLTPPQFPKPIKRGKSSFWPLSLIETYRKGQWTPSDTASE